MQLHDHRQHQNPMTNRQNRLLVVHKEKHTPTSTICKFFNIKCMLPQYKKYVNMQTIQLYRKVQTKTNKHINR